MPTLTLVDMTCNPPVAETRDSAVDRAQLHLALALVSYMSGSVDRSQSEAEAVLAEPGLPASLYSAAEQSRLLALLSHRGVKTIRHLAPEATFVRAALAWRAGCLDETLEMLSAAARSDMGSESRGCYPGLGLATVYAALGQFDDARTCVLGAAEEIALRGDPLWTAAPALYSARVELAAGRLDAANAAATRGVEAASELGTAMLVPIGLDVLVAVALYRGDLEQAVRLREQLRPDSVASQVPFGTPNPAWSALRLREAHGASILGGDGRRGCAFDLVATDACLFLQEPAAAAWLVRAARRAGDDRRARNVLASVECLAEANRRYPTVAAAAAHARGVADGDTQPLAAAAAGHASPWARASAAEDCAAIEAKHGDRATARSWLEHAAEEYLASGASRDHARIRSRLRELGVRRGHWTRQHRPVSGWDSLTETELSVAALVAEGLSNQQVATRMFLSRHTVDFHLRHIFRKLGIDSRVVLTRIALSTAEAS